MTLKSTSSPLDQMLLTEWRTQICGIKGIDYSSQPTAWQTLFDDIVNRAFEYVSQRMAHHPHGQQETTLTVTAGADTTYSMPASMRHVVSIHEVATDGSILQVNYTEKRRYYEAPQGVAGSHPWSVSRNPYWFFDGLTSDQPPVQQWRRIGDDNAGATVYVLYRPYFNILGTSGQDAYPYLPASENAILFHFINAELAAADKDYTAAQLHVGFMDRHIEAAEVNDRETVEAPRRLGGDDEFGRLLG